MVTSFPMLDPLAQLYQPPRQALVMHLFYSCLNKVTKVHSLANSAMLLIFLQVRSSVAVGTPDYISPEILQVCLFNAQLLW